MVGSKEQTGSQLRDLNDGIPLPSTTEANNRDRDEGVGLPSENGKVPAEDQVVRRISSDVL